MEKTKDYTKRNLWFYPMGTVGRDMMYALFTSFVLTYILLTRTLTNAQYITITAIMIGARVFDALNDPIMGWIIEKTRTKWGKFKPWLAAGVLSTAGVLITIFNVTVQGWGFVAIFGVIYFLYSITFTMNDISYWGMVPALSSDADLRNQFTSRAVFFAGIGSALAGLLIPMLTVGSLSITGSAQTSYGVLSIAISIIACGTICFTLFGVKEPNLAVKVEGEAAPRTKLKDVIKIIAKNKPLVWIIVAFLIHSVGNAIVSGGLGSTYVYFAYGYEGSKYSLFSTIGLAVTAILMIIYPMISRKINRKPLMSIMLMVSVVGYALMILSGFIFVGNDIGFWILTAGYSLANFGQYGFYLIMMISILNTVEYNEYAFGERQEGIIASVRPFITKLASAIVVGLTSISYLVFGVLNYTNEISELEQSCTKGEITEATKLTEIATVIGNVDSGQKIGLLLFMTVLPLALLLASYFIYKFKYTLDEDEYKRICDEIQARKESKE